jgi:uncharacterized RmlC-like cupin family protein
MASVSLGWCNRRPRAFCIAIRPVVLAYIGEAPSLYQRAAEFISADESVHQPTKAYPMQTSTDTSMPVEGGDGIFVIRGSGNCRAWNGIEYKTGMHAKNVGAKKLSMNVATIPPGGVARAHIHVDFDVMLYILQGKVRHEYGPGLKKIVDNQAGDFIYIEPGVPHEVFNLSATEPVVAVVARSDPTEWENIIPYDRHGHNVSSKG